MTHSSPHISPEKFSSPNGEAAREQPAVAVAREAKSSARPAGKESGKLFHLSRRTQSLMGVQIVGTGAYVPENVVSNQDLEEQFGVEPGWVEQRTGILNRRHVADGEATSQMCSEAARRAIHSARINKNDIDLVVVGTFTPDYHCPSTACLVQDELKLDAPALDVQAACSGFVYALVTAAQYVATGNSKMALVVGGDTNSRIVNPWEKKVAPLFGDGAGAVILTRGTENQGLLCYQMGADGSGGPLLQIPNGGTASPSTMENLGEGGTFLQMEGRSVFQWAVQALSQTIGLMLETTGLSVNDVACYLIHQANIRIIQRATQNLGIDPERIHNNLEKYGNTSAASIPLALDEAISTRNIQRGDTLLFSGFGAGLTWGTALFRW